MMPPLRASAICGERWDRLQERNRELERELEAARARIAELEQTVARLTRQLERARPPQPGEPERDQPEVTIDESKPNASPRALLRAMTESYEEHLGEMEIGEDGDRTRALYLRQLERWLNRVNREFRAPLTWTVRVLETEETRAGHALRVLAIDPKSGARLGEAFEMELPRRLARRYEQLLARQEAEVLQIRGTLVPQARLNRERMSPGPFNVPPLIGPFAEFGFRIELSSVAKPGDDAPEQREGR
jgi:hypothetical protein